MNSNFLKLFILGLMIECAKSQSINLLENTIFISWTNKGFLTSFYASANIGNGISVNNAWLGIGLNTQSTMNGASVSICKSGSEPSIRTFYNSGYKSTVLVGTNPSFGLSNMIVKVVGSNLTCSFDRINIISRPNYIQLGQANDSVYIIAAYGSGEPQSHAARDKSLSPSSFKAVATTTAIITTKTTKAINITKSVNNATVNPINSTKPIITTSSFNVTKPVITTTTSITKLTQALNSTANTNTTITTYSPTKLANSTFTTTNTKPIASNTSAITTSATKPLNITVITLTTPSKTNVTLTSIKTSTATKSVNATITTSNAKTIATTNTTFFASNTSATTTVSANQLNTTSFFTTTTSITKLTQALNSTANTNSTITTYSPTKPANSTFTTANTKPITVTNPTNYFANNTSAIYTTTAINTKPIATANITTFSTNKSNETLITTTTGSSNTILNNTTSISPAYTTIANLNNSTVRTTSQSFINLTSTPNSNTNPSPATPTNFTSSSTITKIFTTSTSNTGFALTDSSTITALSSTTTLTPALSTLTPALNCLNSIDDTVCDYYTSLNPDLCNIGYYYKQMLSIVCPKSCKRCGGSSQTTTLSNIITTATLCKNIGSDFACDTFASLGYCFTNAYYGGILFKEACQRSCNLCSVIATTVFLPSCTDSQDRCSFWDKYCYLLQNQNPHPCRKTCKIC